jgi:hypothetical protein
MNYKICPHTGFYFADNGRPYHDERLTAPVAIGFSAANRYPFVRGGDTIRSLHRLVAELWHGDIPKGYQVDHIDHNCQNFHPDNLQIITAKENASRRRPKCSVPRQKNFEDAIELYNAKGEIAKINELIERGLDLKARAEFYTLQRAARRSDHRNSKINVTEELVKQWLSCGVMKQWKLLQKPSAQRFPFMTSPGAFMEMLNSLNVSPDGSWHIATPTDGNGVVVQSFAKGMPKKTRKTKTAST